jgi:hypothetical protein
MSIREVPKSYVYTCDVCNAEHVQENANGCYTNSTPPGWSTIKIIAADVKPRFNFEEYLLCETCGPRLLNPILGTLKARAHA